MGAGGTRLRLQAGWWAWGLVSICLSQQQQLSAVQSTGPTRPRGPSTQPAAVCDPEIEDTLGARGHKEGRQVRALTTSARTCPRCGELAQPGAGCSQDGLSPCLSPPLRTGLLSAEWLLLGVWSLQRGLQAPAGKGWRWWVLSRVGSAGPAGHSARCPGCGSGSLGRATSALGVSSQHQPLRQPWGHLVNGQPEPVSHLFPPGHLHTPCVLNQRPCEGRKNFSPTFWPTQGPGG